MALLCGVLVLPSGAAPSLAASDPAASSWLGASLFGCSLSGLRAVPLGALRSGSRDWSFAAAAGASGELDRAGGPPSVQSATITAASAGLAAWRRNLPAPSAGSVLRFTAHVSTENVAGGFGAYLAVSYRSASGSQLGVDESVPALGDVAGALGDAEVWSTVPAGAATVALELVLDGAGEASFTSPALASAAPVAASAPSSVTLTPTSTVLGRLDTGFGVQTNPFEFSSMNGFSAASGATEASRLKALAPAWARVFVSTAWWATPTGFDFDTPMAEALLAEAQLYAAIGTRLNLVVWEAPSWSPPYGALAADLVVLLTWLKAHGAADVGLVTLGNEPDSGLIPGTGTYGKMFPSVVDYEEAMVVVRQALDAADDSGIGLVNGDVAVAGDGFARATAAQLSSDSAQLSFHLYVPYRASLCAPVLRAGEMAELAASTGRSAVLWESNLQGGSGHDPTFSPGDVGGVLLSSTYGDALKLAAFYLQALASGVTGISYWEAMDMSYPSGDLMQYGLWGASGPVRPVYFAYELLSRLLVPGSSLRAVSGGTGSVIAYEAVEPNGGTSLLVLNPWASSVRVHLQVPGRTALEETVLDASSVQQAEATGALSLSPIAVGSRSSMLPAQSMAVFSLGAPRVR